jgi:polysaccharide biosynthesis protein PslG
MRILSLRLVCGIVLSGSLVVGATATAQTNQGSPFGVASGAEWAGDYPRFEPMLHEAGVGWVRYFPEWHSLQPKQGEWDWKRADEFVAKSRENHIQITAPLCYFAPWASSGNDGRTFPVKDMAYWRDFVTGVVGRYHKDIQYWEMWNEPQAFQKNGTPQMYADMVRAAYEAGKRADPEAKFGLTSANFALSYLNMVLKAGAKDHFDYLCVHPYENMELLKRLGGEIHFLSMAGNLRRLLAAHGQRADIPLWITEIGWQAPIEANAEKEAEQAQLLVKAYVLALAQGFERVFWFEARGPAYGKGTDHGLIRKDWTPRPSLTAMEVMTTALGDSPKFAGYHDWFGSHDSWGDSTYMFLFESEDGCVLVAWSPVGEERKLRFRGPVTVLDLAGKERNIPEGEEVVLTNVPLFIAGLPEETIREIKGNRDRAFPWGKDYSAAEEVSCSWARRIGGPRGLEALSEPETRYEDTWWKPLLKKGGGLNFRASPTFAPFGTTNLEIKIVARRAESGQAAGFQLMYETLKTTHGYERAGYWTIPEGTEWQEHTWRVTDANFVGTWGYNFGITEISGDFVISSVSVRKIAAP